MVAFLKSFNIFQPHFYTRYTYMYTYIHVTVVHRQIHTYIHIQYTYIHVRTYIHRIITTTSTCIVNYMYVDLYTLILLPLQVHVQLCRLYLHTVYAFRSLRLPPFLLSVVSHLVEFYATCFFSRFSSWRSQKLSEEVSARYKKCSDYKLILNTRSSVLYIQCLEETIIIILVNNV